MLKTLELGIHRTPSAVVPNRRPLAQYDAVEKITQAPGYEYACSNPFTDELRIRVRVTFIFMYFVRVDDKIKLRAVKVTPGGKITDITPASIK